MSKVDEMIKIYIYPILDEECKRLKIPRDFIEGIYGSYQCSCVIILTEEEKVKVRIKLRDTDSLKDLLSDFFHEMWHVNEIYHGKTYKFSELRATIYEKIRLFQYLLSK